MADQRRLQRSSSNPERPTRRARSSAFVAVAIAALMLIPASAPPALAAGAPAAVRFGMDIAAIGAQDAAGVKPDYGLFWIGPWTLKSGWGGPDQSLANAAAQGVTPVIQFYYWGDDISQSCLENGCWSSLHDAWKSKANWTLLAEQLAAHLNTKLQGKPAVIVLETEFNKADVQTYEALDGYLKDKADYFRAEYPAAKLVLGLGNWGSANWGTWDRAAAAVDEMGLQAMRGSTKNSLTAYYDLVSTTIDAATRLRTQFAKPVFVTDVALSTHPEPAYLGHQANMTGQIFERLDELKGAGVTSIVYRSHKDNPTMDLANWYGEAERHWGLVWHGNGTAKPAWAAWVDGVKAERANPAPVGALPPALPKAGRDEALRVEGEAFATRSAGGQANDATASGGKVWNLWSNGHAAQGVDVVSTGIYEVRVRARGDALGGIAPHMAVTLGGAPVLVADPGPGLQNFTARVRLDAPGARELRVAFDNDAKTNSEDRNLILDFAEVTWLGGLPAASSGNATRVEAEDFADRAAGAVVDDRDAAGGLALRLTEAAAVAHDLTLPAGRYAFRAVARGVAQDAAWPDLQLSLDGKPLAVRAVKNATYKVYTAEGSVPTGGAHRFGLAFTNDMAPAGGQDLAVVLDRIAVENLGPLANAAPVPRFDFTALGLQARFDASATSDADGDVPELRWDFGDGATATGKVATHAYAAGGNYTVALTATDGKATVTRQQAVHLERPNRAPEPAFTWSSDGLTVSVSGTARDPDGDALAPSWDFGDGTTAQGWTASHAYAANGTYAIKLAVTDGALVNRTFHEVAVRAKAEARPAKPVLDEGLAVVTAAAGDRATFAFTVRNDGDQPLALAELGVELKGREVTLLAAGPLTLEPGGTFAFRAGATLDAGTYGARPVLRPEGAAQPQAIPAGDPGTAAEVTFTVA